MTKLSNERMRTTVPSFSIEFFPPQTVEGVAVEPDWDLAAQATPDFEVDQRISWVVNLVPGLVNRAFHTD